MKKYLYILFIVNTSFLYGAYNSNVQENPYEEKFEIISTSPFYEGQILSQSDETPKQNEVDYEELKLISMREFDIASDEEEKKEKKEQKIKVFPPAKIMTQEEPVQATKVMAQEESIQKIEEPVKKLEEQVKKIEEKITNTDPKIKVFPPAKVMQPVEVELEILVPKKIQVTKKEPEIKAKAGDLEAKLAIDEDVQIIRLKPQESKKEVIKPKNIQSKTSIDEIENFEQILIEVDSVSNSMKVKAKIDNEYKDIKIYRVSTAKKDTTKPLGIGNISKISLNPIWYPTQSTKISFKKRGIILPDVVPPGHKFNYMGAAKINLTHIVDGKSTYRIHGTLNEKTIGTNESAGCIRMKNDEVLQLATLLNKFANLKSMDDIKVVLK